MIIRLITLLCLSLLFAKAGFTQSDSEETRYYDVEIIIFKNTRGPKGNELTLAVNSPQKESKMLNLSSRKSIQAASKKDYTVLDAKQLRLDDRVKKIVKSPYYELLVHTGWRQPGLEKDKAMPIWIRGGRKFGPEFISIDQHMTNLANSDSNEFADNSSGILASTTLNDVAGDQPLYELEGTITIALARYLHTYTDLVLRRPKLSLEDTLENLEQVETFPRTDISDTRILNNHSMKEHRRMRSKTLHYLDNPEFSMLILITPADKKTISTAANQ